MRYHDRKEMIVKTYIEMYMDDAGRNRKPTIASLMERVGASRKVFYYYFKSIEDLDIRVFRDDLASLLRRRFDESELVYEEAGDPELTELPYYARRYATQRLMDQTEFFACFAQCLDGRREYYARLLADNRPGSFTDYLFTLYQKALREDAEVVLRRQHLAPTTLDHISRWITSAFFYEMVSWLISGKPMKDWTDVAPFCNIQHEILYMYSTFTFEPDVKRLNLSKHVLNYGEEGAAVAPSASA